MSNTTTLFDSFNTLVTPALTERLSALTGESGGAVAKALAAAAPVMVSGLTQRASDPGNMSQITSLLSSPAVISAAVGNVGNLPNLLATTPKSPLLDVGSGFLSAVFGPQQGTVTGALAQHAGITNASASTVLRYAAPLLMGLLSEQIRMSGLSGGRFLSWLGGQRNAGSVIPASLIDAAGLGNIGDAVGAGAAAARRGAAEASSRASRWLWPAVAALLLVGLGAWLIRSLSTTAVVNAPAVSFANLGAFADRQLPNGVTLNLPALGIENQLIAFITDASRPLEPPHWLNFDRLQFETGAATLRAESQQQLRNIAEVLKAYPGVHARIGGYTDNVGNPASNLQLSQQRADNVRNELVRLGVASDRLTAEGYGEQHPLADNSTEAGRAQNRRIALRVTRRS
jgi:outer membrane protein OmpA-like peptidoglycan-associated protein